MNKICISVPSLKEAHTIELEVTVNGTRRVMNYRIDSVDWSPAALGPDDRLQRLRRFIEAYDPRWELVHIGAPTEDVVPVMFRERPMVR